MNLITINKNTINNQEIQTVNARELHGFLESGRDFSNWIQERVETYGFVDGMDFTTNLLKTPNGGRPRTEYHLSLGMAKELSMVERNEKGKQARQYFIKCEEVVKSRAMLPNFNNAAEAARAWADQYEQNQKLAIDLNNAVKTKAEIGSRREATAMATASAATRKANQLQKELDQSQTYATVKRMTMIHHGIKFNWRSLKKTSEDMGLLPIDVFDQNYGTVKAYHADVWKRAYAVEFERLDA